MREKKKKTGGASHFPLAFFSKKKPLPYLSERKGGQKSISNYIMGREVCSALKSFCTQNKTPLTDRQNIHDSFPHGPIHPTLRAPPSQAAASSGRIKNKNKKRHSYMCGFPTKKLQVEKVNWGYWSREKNTDLAIPSFCQRGLFTFLRSIIIITYVWGRGLFFRTTYVCTCTKAGDEPETGLEGGPLLKLDQSE